VNIPERVEQKSVIQQNEENTHAFSQASIRLNQPGFDIFEKHQKYSNLMYWDKELGTRFTEK